MERVTEHQEALSAVRIPERRLEEKQFYRVDENPIPSWQREGVTGGERISMDSAGGTSQERLS
jgi:hypothetical protein